MKFHFHYRLAQNGRIIHSTRLVWAPPRSLIMTGAAHTIVSHTFCHTRAASRRGADKTRRAQPLRAAYSIHARICVSVRPPPPPATYLLNLLSSSPSRHLIIIFGHSTCCHDIYIYIASIWIVMFVAARVSVCVCFFCACKTHIIWVFTTL